MAMIADTPDLPNRHPGRFYRVETQDLPPRSLSDEHIDLWEHATLLFYGYEWQASAENFLYLSSVIDHQYESAQCLLNAALIYARLGEYHVAAEALEGAARADQFRALAIYLFGHVAFELGELQESEWCFKAALSELDGRKQHFGRLGLDFVLDAPKIQHNLQAFDIENISLDSIPDLGAAALPANSVFESPQRSADSGYASPESPTKSMGDSQFERELEEPAKRTPKALLAQNKSPPITFPTTQTLRALEYRKGGVQWHEPTIPSKEQMAVPLSSKKSLKSISGLVRQISARRKQAEEPKPKSPTTSPRTSLFARLVPRDAKVKDDSVRDLAGFIRDLPPQQTVEPHHEPLNTVANSEALESTEEAHEEVEHEMHSVESHDFVGQDSPPTDQETTHGTQPSMEDPYHEPANASYMQSEVAASQESVEEDSYDGPRGRTFARSVRSVYTEDASGMADDEASDSGNETDRFSTRASTPTPAARAPETTPGDDTEPENITLDTHELPQVPQKSASRGLPPA